MPGVGLNPNVAFVPPPGGVDYMGNEVAPEYMFDQGLNYPAANNYGYYCTGSFFCFCDFIIELST